MNQGVVFAIASAALLSTVAAAHMFAPLPDGTQRGGAKAATVASGPATPQQTSSVPISSPKPMLVETRQAPVPILMRERPPVALSVSESDSAMVPAQTTPVADIEDTGFARGAIEADGYKSVKNIIPGPDGTWRARALRGKTEVVLTVDREGRVSVD
jgi:hypothetical protein